MGAGCGIAATVGEVVERGKGTLQCVLFFYYYWRCSNTSTECKQKLLEGAPVAVNSADPGNGDLLGQLASAGTGYEMCMNLKNCMAKQPPCIKMMKNATERGGFAISWANGLIGQ